MATKILKNLPGIIKKILLFSIIQILFLLIIPPTIADNGRCTDNTDCTTGQICYGNTCTPADKVLLPDLSHLKNLYEETEIVENLPKVSSEGFFTTVIKTILAWAMSLTIIAIVVSAIYYLKSRGQEEDITKAKNILIYLVIGMAIMAAAYGIVSGVTKFKFFQAVP